MRAGFSRTYFLSSLVIVAALFAACGKAPMPPSTGTQGAPQVAVIAVRAQRLPLTTELPGRISPTLVAEVRPQVTGIIQSRQFKEGGTVQAGDVLYQIDPATYRASVDNARAALAKAEAQQVVAKLKADRLKELAVIKAASQQDSDDAAAALLQADADIASAKADLQMQRINLNYTRVLAPISGRIGRSTVTPGALVTANQSASLATVQQLDPIYVDVTQSSTQLLALGQALASGQLKSGSTQVKLILENGTSYPLPGKLQASEVTVDQGTGAITLRAEFPNPNGALLPGMYVRAIIEEGVLEQAVLVPQPAVTRDATGQAIAFVVDSEGKLEQRALQTSRAIGDQWLISSGLKPGEKVVVEGQQKAQPGAVVVARSL